MYARDHGMIATPIGMIRIDGDDERLFGITIGVDGGPRAGAATCVRAALDQLESYFHGTLRHFDLPLCAPRSSRGQMLRDGLVAVGYGDTMSYGTLARRLHSGPRAIGQLCARNPFPILVPCHRVVSANGALGNYSAGGGTTTKAWLLDHERHHNQGVI